MSKKKKRLAKLMSGDADENFPFDDFVAVIVDAGWQYRRTTGSHIMFTRKEHPIINVQKDGGKAKSYQVEQVRELIKKAELGGRK